MKEIWWKEAVVYQIYPRSFMDSNGDGIGDLAGITSKLDYLKRLGIDVIWLSPIYSSPNDDNGYDISDYQNIMAEFGTMEDFDKMLKEAHDRGIKIMMDLVVNHTSDEHAWFVESRKSIDNPYRDYYIWRKGKEDGSEPNNWGSCFSGSAWQYDADTDMYFLHLFSPKQPDLNWDNAVVRKEIYDMMTWWCEKGIDGFRMDVISMISKVAGLPDDTNISGLYGDFSPYCVHGPNVHHYLKEMNHQVLSKYDLMTVGETAGVTIEQAKLYAGESTNELNMVFHFEHVELGGKYGKWTDTKAPIKELKKILSKWQTELKGEAWNSLYWCNHDQPRAVSRFGDDRPEYHALSAKMLATCLHMMQGTPYIYQGEELGMTNYPFVSIDEFKDIESINAYKEWVGNGLVDHDEMMRCLSFKGRDNARTPMQWDASPNAGFTTDTPWIAVNPNYKVINAKEQVENPDSIFCYYKTLIDLRKKYKVIVYGEYESVMPESDTIFAYTRVYKGEKILIVCNFTDTEQDMIIPEDFKGDEDITCIVSNYGERDYKDRVVLQPYESFVLYTHIKVTIPSNTFSESKPMFAI